MIWDNFFERTPLEQIKITKAQKEIFEERNRLRAFQWVADNLRNDDNLFDHLHTLHSLIIEDVYPVSGFRTHILGIFRRYDGVLLSMKNYEDIPEKIQIIKNLAKRLEGLERLAFEHFYFLEIHPFEDGNGRLARLILMISLDRLGAKHFYRSLENPELAYQMAVDSAFQKNDFREILKYLKKIVCF